MFSFCDVPVVDLFSFPTRRSSDLVVDIAADAIAIRVVERIVRAGVAGISNLIAVGRSEEHTSELQSHSDLVCRLLVENKKKDSWACVQHVAGALGLPYVSLLNVFQ